MVGLRLVSLFLVRLRFLDLLCTSAPLFGESGRAGTVLRKAHAVGNEGKRACFHPRNRSSLPAVSHSG